MKKFLFGAMALVMLAGASCSKDSENAGNVNIPRELSDSISMYCGSSLGYYVLSDYLNYVKHSDAKISKEDMLKGIQMAFANAESEGTVAGLQVGAQIINQLNRYEEEGVKIDRALVFKNFRKVFEGDSVSMDDIAIANSQMNVLMNRVQEIKAEAEKASQAEEAQMSQAQTDEYISQLKAQDPEIQTTASGLSYKIINPGTEPRVQDNSAIDVYYVGRLTDGTVFDQTQENPATFSPSGVIPGFAEGLKMLGKGGKAVLYIPGELAYGPNGVPQAGIGPNAMLVFEVEIADVRNPE